MFRDEDPFWDPYGDTPSRSDLDADARAEAEEREYEALCERDRWVEQYEALCERDRWVEHYWESLGWSE